MNDFQKNYVNNLNNYFGSKYIDDERLFRTVNRFLKGFFIKGFDLFESLLGLVSGK